jgi:membrane-bound inhibitor of C-type lysozyme
MGLHEVIGMNKLAMRHGMAMVALGGLLAGMAMGQAAPATPTGSAQGQKEVRSAIQWTRFDYTCKGGAKLAVYLHDPTAKVEYKGHQYLMRRTKSADGIRYSDGKVVWWNRGGGGFLQQDSQDGYGKMIVEGCKLAKQPQTGGAKKP